MNLLNHEWLGYAATPEAANRITTETGIFFLVLAAGYLLAFLYSLWYSKGLSPTNRRSCLGIIFCALIGAGFFTPSPLLIVGLSTFLSLFALVVLFRYRYTYALIHEATIELPKTLSDHKTVQYALVLMKRTGYTLRGLIDFNIRNGQALWFLILYRALITLRASLF